MRFACFLVLLATTFTASDKNFANSVEAALGDVARVSDMKRIDPDSKSPRLRGRKKPESEERMMAVPPYAAMTNVMHSTSTTSTTSKQSPRMLHSMEEYKAQPKRAKALAALLTIGMLSGAFIGGFKLTEWIRNALGVGSGRSD
ncbi:hypothetical protein L914_06649 [Phytophthora nicotianae]|uniref:RxLR effector protein n=2 Tax=Phytophthora nicotianae TaxID=4792 RepID=V9FCN0_PHYNI|nr:hypothetical protein F443_06865 [Phytophthora nicotianae P1569]ETM48878.1 hypothetical protein L914_06649 [Phytophthora nicotianae]